ncbi:MAG: SPASM domain-containing protein, partial [Candidatus Hydrogenedentes bacterium]|nr:SPASM domain-containing protein [Candidatus Hydrogenedentota bacterium]
DPGDDGLELISPDSELDGKVTEWSVRPAEYGKFLSTIFDEWVRRDVGKYYVQIFDISLEAWLGMQPSLCVFQETCGKGMALEHTGDLYSCDHYVYPENKLGNIMDEHLSKLVNSPQQQKFGLDKRDALPNYCRECPVYFVCHGECPKHRFIETPDGEPGLNYLCQGYKHFFTHIDPYMRFMANELRNRRAPANVMQWTLQQDMQAQGRTEPKPNDLCLCGSGKKFKKCCGKKG